MRLSERPRVNLNILGFGTALPPHRMTQAEATELAQQVLCRTDEQARLVQVLYRRAGVKQRFTVVPHRIALTWTAGGGREAENGNGLSPSGIGGISPEGV